MIFLYQEIYDLVFHEYAGPHTYGKNNYTFILTNGEIEDWHRNNLDYEFMDAKAKYIKGFQDVCEGKEIDFMFFIPSSKEAVYPEYFPSTILQSESEVSRMDILLDALHKYNVNHVYTKDYFLSIKDQEQLYAVKYDPAHWNSNGAYEGIYLLLNEMKSKFPDLNLQGLKKEWFQISDRFVRKQLNSDWIINDTLPEYELIETKSYRQEKYPNLECSSYYSCYVNPDEPDGKTVLVFHDSYLMGRELFFTDNFAEVVFIHNENINRFEYYLDLFSPDAVVFESVQWGLLRSPVGDPLQYISYVDAGNGSLEAEVQLSDSLTKIAVTGQDDLTVVKGNACFKDGRQVNKVFATVGDIHYSASYNAATGEFSVAIPTTQLQFTDQAEIQLVDSENYFSEKKAFEIVWLCDKEQFFAEQ
ncbi:MAG: hypothetical protein K2N87_04070 [Eubacterium sp.]|nr:hypothetical protein [Eubacterium sp.]